MKKIFLISIVLLMGFSCTNYIEDQNIDPNEILGDAVESKFMIKGVMYGNQLFQAGPIARITMMWMNQATGSDRQYISINNWNSAGAADFNNGWGYAYRNVMFHATETTRKALEEGKPHLAAVAMIIKAEAAGIAASLWGDIPLSEAFDYETYPNPAFDDQESVYAATQALLDEAILMLEEPSDITIENDIYFNGNVQNWIKVAHGLKARFYLHVSDYTKANQHALLGMSSPADDYRCNFDENLNHFYGFLTGGRIGYLTSEGAFAPELLHPQSDLYRGHAGHTNELIRLLTNYGFDKLNLEIGGWGKFQSDAKLNLVTRGEMLLIQTEYEARENGLSAGLAKYNEYRALLRSGYSVGADNDCGGQDCSGFYLDYAETDFNVGGMENEDGIDPLQAFLRELYEERYVYFIAHFESFTDFRRTNNIAEIQLRSEFDNSPQRILYPETEINSNDNVPSPLPGVTDKTRVHQ